MPNQDQNKYCRDFSNLASFTEWANANVNKLIVSENIIKNFLYKIKWRFSGLFCLFRWLSSGHPPDGREEWAAFARQEMQQVKNNIFFLIFNKFQKLLDKHAPFYSHAGAGLSIPAGPVHSLKSFLEKFMKPRVINYDSKTIINDLILNF